MRRRYFAYGSNICRQQMAQRCPTAEPGDVAALADWRFRINRRGVATLVFEPGAVTAGVLWHLTAACEAALDRCEGVERNVYRKAALTVGDAPALVYLASEEHPGPPRPGYLETILAAAQQWGIAPERREEIAAWGQTVAPWLVRTVLAGYQLDHHGIHGPGHWLRVRANGLALAAQTPGADVRVVELFALLHDCRRQHDGGNHGHGARAAAYAATLAEDGLLRLAAEPLERLLASAAGHELGKVSSDPTIGCCWDADRLELSRLGRRPVARLLSTAAAHDPAMQAQAWRRGRDRWTDAAAAAAWGLAPEAVAVGRASRPTHR